MKQERSKKHLFWTLFTSMLSLSAFTFGGSYVIVTLMKKRFVDELGWLEEQEMLDMTALAQSCPGPIAVNTSILVGWKLARFWGMVVAVLGTAIPPLVILSIISLFYKAFAENRYVAMTLKGMQAGVAAVMLDVVVTMGNNVIKKRSVLHIILMIFAFICVFFLDVNVIFIILAAALIGIISVLFARKKGDLT
ncbi:MAG: chromate transporter [Oscillospiraceae bacterium]|nr:chromate transporter [Oscillospiraceae bacterium]